MAYILPLTNNIYEQSHLLSLSINKIANEIANINKTLNTTDIWLIVSIIGSLFLTFIAIFISGKTARTQNKIALFEKRYELFAEWECLYRDVKETVKVYNTKIDLYKTVEKNILLKNFLSVTIQNDSNSYFSKLQETQKQLKIKNNISENNLIFYILENKIIRLKQTELLFSLNRNNKKDLKLIIEAFYELEESIDSQTHNNTIILIEELTTFSKKFEKESLLNTMRKQIQL